MRRRQRRIHNSKARRPAMRSLAGRFFFAIGAMELGEC